MQHSSLLNPSQQEAVAHLHGPLLVLAGAGSGKTRIVTYRIAHLLQSGIPASAILAVTFTNKAAGEMRERIFAMTDQQVVITTFHSLGVKILRQTIDRLGYRPDFLIYDEDDSLKMLKSALTHAGVKDSAETLRGFRAMISQAKNSLISPDNVQVETTGSAWERLLPQVYAAYQRMLKEANAVDFDDLLFLPVELFSKHLDVLAFYQHHWQYLLIDEYQDTNQAQYILAKQLVAKSGNIFAVGDPDQSIYSWRGADLDNILSFEKDFPGARVVRLEQNYRSRNNILQAANSLIAHNALRYKKNLWSSRGDGEKIKLLVTSSDEEEALFVARQIRRLHDEEKVPLHEMAIFYRTNSQSRTFEDALLREKIPYTIVGGLSFYQRKEIKDILAFLRLLATPSDIAAFMRTIHIPKRGLGDATVEKLVNAAVKHSQPILQLCRDLLASPSLLFGVKLTTKQKEGLAEYLTIFRDLHPAVGHSSLSHLVSEVISRTGYLNFLREDKETFTERKENLSELISKAAEWEQRTAEPTLLGFLEELSLKASVDEQKGDHVEPLKLMTLHNGKGLEFSVVFLVGLEEGLCPHINSLQTPAQIEEERRLCYVGMTRAKDLLYLSASRMRRLWGTVRTMPPSRFLKELDQNHLEKISFQPARSAYRPPSPYRERPLLEKANLSSPKHEFSQGDDVLHPSFGRGTVLEATDGSLGPVYKVRFHRDQSIKSLVAQYAQLRPAIH